MTPAEFYATGKRKCKCDDVKFILIFTYLKRYKQRYRDSTKNLIANVLMGQVEIKPQVCYQANCSQCNSLYMASNSKKRMNENVKISGIVPLNKL